MNRRGGIPGFIGAAAVVLALDIASKAVVYRTMGLGHGSIRVVGDVVRLTYIHNAGAAFGLFQGSRWFFVAVSLLSALVIIALAGSGRYRDRGTMVALGLILGGALGNLIDRLWLGVVIDFIDVGFGYHRWPVFNFADMGVTVGVALLALRLLAEGRRGEASESGENGPEEAPGEKASPSGSGWPGTGG